MLRIFVFALPVLYEIRLYKMTTLVLHLQCVYVLRENIEMNFYFSSI